MQYILVKIINDFDKNSDFINPSMVTNLISAYEYGIFYTMTVGKIKNFLHLSCGTSRETVTIIHSKKFWLHFKLLVQSLY